MAFIRTQVRLKRVGALPEDDIVNTWHVDSDNAASAVIEDWHDRLQLFYEQMSAEVFSPLLTGDISMASYNLEDDEPRVPFATREDDMGTPTGQPLPAEVAACLSMRAEYESGVNRARRRGRIFLGPCKATIATAEGPDVRINSSGYQAIIEAAQDLSVAPAGGARMAVYSRREDQTETLADSFNDVVAFWVDNAFDTQRRRGARATLRYPGLVP